MAALRAKLARWADEWKLALAGVGLASRFWEFWAVFASVFVVFATLLNMFALFPSAFQYLFGLPGFGRKLDYLGQMFLGTFGYKKENWLDFVPILLISVLQGLIIALIILVWKKRRALKKTDEVTGSTGAQLSKAGIATGLAVLAGGCPTCGTSLLAPLIGVIFSGSSAAVGNTVSSVLTLLAILIALYSFRKVGLEAYVIIVSERRRKREEQRKR